MLVPLQALLVVVLSAPPAGPNQTDVPRPQIVPFEAPKPTWYRRRPHGDTIVNPNGQGLIDLARWPTEPESPETVDPERFAAALGRLCPPTYRRGTKLYAGWILEHSSSFEVDPFTVAALTYYRSNCRARFSDNGSYGLSAINLKMHAGYLVGRVYRYWLRVGGAWKEKGLPMKKHLFYKRSLKHAEPNIYFAAGILRVLTEQCSDIDSAFGSVRHRHPVSHFFWGDLVRGTDAEDRVLIARRRLLGYYHGDAARTVLFDGVRLRSPLDGGPRKVTGKMDDNRDGGRRRHRGIDFASDRGEGVYAVSDGEVVFAGAQRKDATINLKPKEARAIAGKDFGRGGLLVMVRHTDRLVSAYMHLDRYVVKNRQKVRSGDLLGYVGRTGVKESAAHLHFELRVDRKHIDPIPALQELVISPMATFRGRRMDAEQRRLRKRERKRKRRRRRK